MTRIEIIGHVASIFIIASLLFKTTSFKGTIFMRILNIIGSVMFAVYGFCLPALSTAYTNCAAIAICIYYTVREVVWHKKGQKGKLNQNDQNG